MRNLTLPLQKPFKGSKSMGLAKEIFIFKSKLLMTYSNCHGNSFIEEIYFLKDWKITALCLERVIVFHSFVITTSFSLSHLWQC